MNRNYLSILAVSALVLFSAQVMASNNVINNNNDDSYRRSSAAAPAQLYNSDLAEFERDAVFVEPNNDVVQQAVLTYEEQAKILGAKIVEGFKKTSPSSAVTGSIAWFTNKYAKLIFGADSITEGYLLKGKEKGLDLSDMKAVYKHLSETFNGRITTNVDTVAGAVPVKAVGYVGKGLHYGGDAYYNYRLEKALEWAYQQDKKSDANSVISAETLDEEVFELESSNDTVLDQKTMADIEEHIAGLERLYNEGTISAEELVEGTNQYKNHILQQIDSDLSRGEPIEDLVAKTQALQDQLETFNVATKAKSSWFKLW